MWLLFQSRISASARPSTSAPHRQKLIAVSLKFFPQTADDSSVEMCRAAEPTAPLYRDLSTDSGMKMKEKSSKNREREAEAPLSGYAGEKKVERSRLTTRSKVEK